MKLFKDNKKVTVTRFKVIFKTVDGEMHKRITNDYYDVSKISNNNVLGYYLIGKDFLYDSEYNAYPIHNIIKITMEEVESKVVEEESQFTVIYE